jgi:hypothetical protein
MGEKVCSGRTAICQTAIRGFDSLHLLPSLLNKGSTDFEVTRGGPIQTRDFIVRWLIQESIDRSFPIGF